MVWNYSSEDVSLLSTMRQQFLLGIGIGILMLYDVKSPVISSADALGTRCLGWRTSGSV